MMPRTEDVTVTGSAPTVAVVGLGYGRAHIAGFQAAGCRVVAVCQRDRQAAQKVAGHHGISAVFDDWRRMLDAARPDIVSIATPPHLHRPIALAALERGAHVLCEKPLAMTAAEGREMAEAARKARRVAMVGFNWRFTPAMQAFQARVSAGALGRVFHVGGFWSAGAWASESAAGTWRHDRDQAGHGVMGDQGVHLVDLIRSAFGEFRRVSAQAGIAYADRAAPGAGHGADTEDHCAVLAELESGAQASFAVTRVARGVTSEHGLEAFGTRGGVRYRVVRAGAGWWNGELWASEGGSPLERVEVAPAPGESGEGAPADVIGRVTIAPLVGRLLAAIRDGASPSPSFDDGVRAQVVLDAVQEAVARRAWIDVPPAP